MDEPIVGNDLVLEMIETLKDIDDAWAGNGSISTAIDTVLIILDKVKKEMKWTNQ